MWRRRWRDRRGGRNAPSKLRCKRDTFAKTSENSRWLLHSRLSQKAGTTFSDSCSPYVVETYSALEMRHLALERCIATATWTKQGTAVNPSDNARLSNEAAKQRLRKSGYPQIFDLFSRVIRISHCQIQSQTQMLRRALESRCLWRS